MFPDDFAPELDRVTLVLLRRPADAPEYSEERLDEIQAEHLAYLRELRQRDVLLTNGPFVDQPDPTWRGMCLYALDVDAARRLAEDDPAVRNGRLAVDAFTWLYPRGSLRFRA